MADVPTTSTLTLRRTLAHADSLGVDTQPLLGRLGLSARRARSSVARIAITHTYDALEWLSETLENPTLGVDLALAPANEYDLVTSLILTSSTLGEGLRLLLRFQRIWGDGEFAELYLEGDEASLVVHHWGPERQAHRLIAQLHLVDLVRYPEAMTGHCWQPVRLELHQPDGATCSRLEEVVGCEVRQGPHTALVVDRSTLDRPMPMATEVLQTEFLRQAEALAARIPSSADLISRVSEVLGQELEAGPVTLARVARVLGRSPRTLQRSLSKSGVSFGAVLRRVRLERALHLLEEGTPITEIASRLGYSETSAFSRAFARWTGRPPSRR